MPMAEIVRRAVILETQLDVTSVNTPSCIELHEALDLAIEALEKLQLSEETSTNEGEIVRCKDCRWNETCCRNIRKEGRRQDDFCSYGKKQITGKLNNPDDSLVTDDSEACKEQKSKLDLISRQAAIDMIDGMIADATSHGITARLDPYYVRHGLEYLPPVEPPKRVVAQIKVDTDEIVERIKEEYEITDRPVCEDAISRADTIKAMCADCKAFFDDDMNCADCDDVAVVRSMPPVEPKRPKTTETMMVDGEPTEIDPESYEVGYTHGQMASKRPTGECRTCKRCSDHCCETAEDFTRCPIEEHYSLPKDGYCHLYEQV